MADLLLFFLKRFSQQHAHTVTEDTERIQQRKWLIYCYFFSNNLLTVIFFLYPPLRTPQDLLLLILFYPSIRTIQGFQFRNLHTCNQLRLI